MMIQKKVQFLAKNQLDQTEKARRFLNYNFKNLFTRCVFVVFLVNRTAGSKRQANNSSGLTEKNERGASFFTISQAQK